METAHLYFGVRNPEKLCSVSKLQEWQAHSALSHGHIVVTAAIGILHSDIAW
jgi:hypothetical protein